MFPSAQNTVPSEREEQIRELSTWKSERTAAQVPDDDALILSFWLLGLAPSSF